METAMKFEIETALEMYNKTYTVETQVGRAMAQLWDVLATTQRKFITKGQFFDESVYRSEWKDLSTLQKNIISNMVVQSNAYI